MPTSLSTFVPHSMGTNSALQEAIATLLSQRMHRPVDVHAMDAVPGGSTGDAYRVLSSAGNSFVKVTTQGEALLRAEADGLARLRATDTVRVPEVWAQGGSGEQAFLLMEHIAQRPADPASWASMGRTLAALHRHGADHFGLRDDRSGAPLHNYIGPLLQVNDPAPDWCSFFIAQRLEPQLKLARDRKRVDAGILLRFERLHHRLDGLMPPAAPSLLHGDLWHGNVLHSATGEAVFIDPAVYYGHREMDLAMSLLFGGFDPLFHTSYEQHFPLEQHWRDRADLFNLYPRLVHLNLFGGSYLPAIRTTLDHHL
jgi:protein-ribulosamine 3-kinase